MATGQGPIYDDSVTWPTNKTDGGAPSVASDWVAADANNQGTFNYAARTALRYGVFHGCLDQAASLPPLSSGTPGALSTTWTSALGQLAASEAGGAYSWLRNVNFINLGDKKRFGAVGDGVADDTAAVLAWLAAGKSSRSSLFLTVLYAPTAVYRLTSPVTIGPALGTVLMGDGPWATQFLIDPASANGDGLIVRGQWCSFRDFGMLGRKANPAGKMMRFRSDTGGAASSYAHQLTNLFITTNDDHDGFDTGIYWDPESGGNSEVRYQNVAIYKHKTCAVDLPGTQQFGHDFNRCDFNGLWDQADPSANGGQFGIRCAGGQFSVRNSNVTTHRTADYNVSTNSDLPCVIDNCDSELSYAATYGAGILSPANAATHVVIRNSRFAYKHGAFNLNGVVSLDGLGTIVIEDNGFFADGTGQYPKISFTGAGFPRGVRIRRNKFNTTNSVSADPLVVYGTFQNFRGNIDMRDNVFADASDNVAFRNEVLNLVPSNTLLSDSRPSSRVEDLWGTLDMTLFKAASPSQTLTFQTGLPQSLTYLDFRVFLNNFLVVTGGATISVKVGTTSGGDELFQSTAMGTSGSGDLTVWYGESSAQRGSAMGSSGGHMPSGSGTSAVYVTASASAGNLGDGTTSVITRGLLQFAVEYKTQPREFT